MVAAAQAAAVALVVALTLDLSPWRGLAVAVVMLVAGLALVVTNQALVAWLGNAGRLVSLAVLAVSIPAALVGTAPEALRQVVAWTPMAAATEALRSGVLAEGTGAAVLALALWTLGGLAVSSLAVRRVRSVPSARLAAPAG